MASRRLVPGSREGLTRGRAGGRGAASEARHGKRGCRRGRGWRCAVQPAGASKLLWAGQPAFISQWAPCPAPARPSLPSLLAFAGEGVVPPEGPHRPLFAPPCCPFLDFPSAVTTSAYLKASQGMSLPKSRGAPAQHDMEPLWVRGASYVVIKGIGLAPTRQQECVDAKFPSLVRVSLLVKSMHTLQCMLYSQF